MTRRSRVFSFGPAAGLVIVGLLCGVVIGGALGQVLALVLIGVGLVAAVSLIFYEVGLTEDHERARELAARETAEGKPKRSLKPRPRPVLDRMRGRRRRLE